MFLFFIPLSCNPFSTVQQFRSLHPSQCCHPPPLQILQVDFGQVGTGTRGIRLGGYRRTPAPFCGETEERFIF